MRLSIIGTGYVGLVTGTCFAEVGHHVTCLDIDQEKVVQLSKGNLPIFEPGLKEKVRKNLEAGRLEFTTSYPEAAEADVIFLCLPTPSREDGSADLSYIEASLRQLAGLINKPTILVSKSTVPVGTADQIREWGGELVKVVSNPEFLKQGNAVNDFMKPDRVIIGVEDEATADVMRELYSPFSVNHDRIMVMDLRSAEMAKYAANAMLATRISFMNELAGLCEERGADISKVRLGLGADSRIGYHYLYAGAGYGGSCFPKDLKALCAMSRKEMPLLEAVQETNESQKGLLFEKICAYFGQLKGVTIGILGLSFKPDTDDMREAPSLVLIEALLEAGASLRLYDPEAMANAQKIIGIRPNVIWCENEELCADGVDALTLVTEWKQFRHLDFEKIECRVLFDGRNQYRPQEMAVRGFDYISIGQPPVLAQHAQQAHTADL